VTRTKASTSVQELAKVCAQSLSK